MSLSRNRLGRTVAVLTCVASLGMAWSSTAAAETVAKSVQAFFGVKIVAGGKTLVTDKEPFIYNGTTYVPLRVVSEALGKKVSWDSTNYQVIISDEPTNSIVHLGSLPPTDWKWYDGKANDEVKLGGETLSPALSIVTSKSSEVTWALNGQYTTLEGIVGATATNRYSESEATFVFMVDGHPKATVKLLKGTAPQPFKVDVSHGLELTISITTPGYPSHAIVGTLSK